MLPYFNFINITEFTYPGDGHKVKILFDLLTNTFYLQDYTGAFIPIGLGGGSIGNTGPPGPPGLNGAQGIQGPIGLTGAAGTNGVQGPIGLTGVAGTNGTTGVQGIQGPIGLTGLTGAAGTNGTNGTNGVQGIQGPIGLTGLTGAAGTNGTNGVQGIQGETGPTGPNFDFFYQSSPPIGSGTSAINIGSIWYDTSSGDSYVYIYDTVNYLWVSLASGSVGPQGIQGVAGPQGIQGITGQAGAQGDKGGHKYLFIGNTTMGDPGQGNLRYNNSTISNVTQIAIDDVGSANVNISNYIYTWDDSTSAIKGYIVLNNNLNTSSSLGVFALNSIVINAGFVLLNVTYVSGNMFSSNVQITVEFYRTGNDGVAGSAGPTGPTGPQGPLLERLSDFQSPYQYSGTAPFGTLTSQNWNINRVDFTTPGSPITLSAIGSWDDRTILIYT